MQVTEDLAEEREGPPTLSNTMIFQERSREFLNNKKDYYCKNKHL